MVNWKVTSGTAQSRFEKAVVALGAEPSVKALGGVMVEVSADLPESYADAVWELLREGVDPSTLTIEKVETKRDEISGRAGQSDHS